MRETATPTSQEPHNPISEEPTEDVTTPMSSDRSLTHPLAQEEGQDQIAVQVIKATKRLLESVRQRDFDAYK